MQKPILFIFAILVIAGCLVYLLAGPSPVTAASPLPTPAQTLTQSEPLTSTNTTPSAENIEVVDYLGGGGAHGIFVQGNYAYLSLGPALEILDVTDMTRPKRLGHIELSNIGAKIYVTDHYAYIATNDPFGPDSLVIVDVSDPARPMQVGSLIPSPGVEDALFKLWVVGRYVYLIDLYTGLHIIDIADPGQPHQVGVYNKVSTIHDLVFQAHLAYVAAGEGGLRILDVADPAHVQELGFFESRKPFYEVELSGNYAYLKTDDTVWIGLDVSDPTRPVRLDPPAANTLTASAPVYAYDLNVPTLSIMDSSNPLARIQVGAYQIPSYPYDVAIVRRTRAGGTEQVYACITTEQNGMRVVDVSDPAAPVEVGAYDPTRFNRGIVIKTKSVANSQSSYAYIYADHGQDQGLAVFDLTNPAAPVEVGFQAIPIEGNTLGFTLAGDYAYLSQSRHTKMRDLAEYRLWLVNVADPHAPQVVNVLTTPGYWTGRAAAVNIASGPNPTSAAPPVYAYLPTGKMDLRIVEVSNPLAPVAVGDYFVPLPPSGALREEQTFGDYVLRLYGASKETAGDYFELPQGSFEILHKGQLVFARTGGPFEAGRVNPDADEVVGLGQDISGDGRPELIITETIGDDFTCYYIFELGQTVHWLDLIEDWNGRASFTNLDSDPALEIVTSDWAFFNWLKLTDYAEPVPRVILDYDGHAYRPAIDLMRQPAPDAQQLADRIRKIQADWAGQGMPPVPVWQAIQDLIYSGHADLAWQFYEQVWPAGSRRSERFMADFVQTMVYSPFWPEIKAMNSGKWSQWPQNLFPSPAMAPTANLLPTATKQSESRLTPVGAADLVSLGLEAEDWQSPQTVFVQGSYAYLGIGSTLIILDVTDPTQPRQTGHLVLPGLIKTMHVDQTTAYIVIQSAYDDGEHGLNGLSIVDVTNPAAPVERSFYQTPSGQAPDEIEVVTTANGYVYFIDDHSLHVLDVSDPTAPTRIGFYPDSYFVIGAAVFKDYIYLTDGYERLTILHFTPPGK